MNTKEHTNSKFWGILEKRKKNRIREGNVLPDALMGPGGSQLAFKTLFKDFSRAIRKLPKKFEREEAVDDLREGMQN